jgi:hypothetical protein
MILSHPAGVHVQWCNKAFSCCDWRNWLKFQNAGDLQVITTASSLAEAWLLHFHTYYSLVKACPRKTCWLYLVSCFGEQLLFQFLIFKARSPDNILAYWDSAFPLVLNNHCHQFLPDFKSYLLNTGSAADGRHNAIPNVIWWDWNDNSGDTGGLIDSSWWAVWYDLVRSGDTGGLIAVVEFSLCAKTLLIVWGILAGAWKVAVP